MLKETDNILQNLFKHSTLTIVEGMLLCSMYEDVSYILKGTDVNIEDNVYLLMLLKLTHEHKRSLKGWYHLKLDFYYKLKEEYGDNNEDMYNLIDF